MSEATHPAEDDWRRGVLRLAPRQPILRGAGDLMSRSLEVFSATFPLTLTLYLLLIAPFDVAMAALGDSGHGAWVSLLQLAPIGWVTMALTYAIAIRDRDGRIPTLGESMNWGRIHWLRAVGYMILVALVVSLGLILLIVPGLILAAWLALVMPIVALEGRGRPAVLQRSRELTVGHRKTLFWTIVVFWGGLTAISVAAAFADEAIGLSPVAAFTNIALGLGSFVLTAMSTVAYLAIVGEKRGLCDNCGYNLTGNITGICPECGSLRTPSDASHPPSADRPLA